MVCANHLLLSHTLIIADPSFSRSHHTANQHGTLTRQFYTCKVQCCRLFTVQSLRRPRLFHFPVVDVPVRELDDGPDDLLSALYHQQVTALKAPNPHSAYIEPAEVFAFQLRRDHNYGATTKKERRPFRYPKHIYLDPFLRENAEKSTELRTLRKALEDEMASLGSRVRAMTNFNVSDDVDGFGRGTN